MHLCLSRILVFTALCFQCFIGTANAQPESVPADGSDTAAAKGEQDVENLYERFESDEKERDLRRKKREEERRERQDKKAPTKLSELKELAPFDDVAVLQRKYLPRTRRFEISTLALIGLNNSFFNNFGGDLRLGYFFTESLGLELLYQSISNTKKQVTKDLEDLSVRTRNLVTPKSYVGGVFKWAPVYGKIAFQNRTIVPFGLYFFLGLGQTETDGGGSSTTTTLGGGQLYAISKSMAFRWDLTGHFYSVETDQVRGTERFTQTQNQSDLHLTVGLSFFFPEAKYR